MSDETGEKAARAVAQTNAERAAWQLYNMLTARSFPASTSTDSLRRAGDLAGEAIMLIRGGR